jgi:hypothetical protein
MCLQLKSNEVKPTQSLGLHRRRNQHLCVNGLGGYLFIVRLFQTEGARVLSATDVLRTLAPRHTGSGLCSADVTTARG